MKIRTSTKIFLGFVAIVAGGYFGWQTYAGVTVDRIKFDPVKPSKVNILGVAPGSGYRILVANHAAQLIRGDKPDDFQAPDGHDGGGGEATEKKRVPIKEMLEALQGDQGALGQFIAVMNEMQETADWPTERIIWKAADIRKALDGDPALKPKLEQAINVALDGAPLKQISMTAHENGIVIEVEVPCQVQVGAEVQELVGTILVPYRCQMSKSIERELKEKAYDLNTVAGYYGLEAQKIADGTGRQEDVARNLEAIIDPKANAELARPAQQVLRSATVVVTDEFITKASARSYEAKGEQLTDLVIELSDEGRKRLWQYSRRRVGFQLLLIVDGVAIAAPRIRHELAQGELVITQMPDKVLVQDAVDAINNKSGVKS